MIHLECVRRQIISMQLQRKLHNNNLGNCYVSSGQTKRKKAGQQATPADEPWKSLYSVLNWGSAPALKSAIAPPHTQSSLEPMDLACPVSIPQLQYLTSCFKRPPPPTQNLQAVETF